MVKMMQILISTIYCKKIFHIPGNRVTSEIIPRCYYAFSNCSTLEETSCVGWLRLRPFPEEKGELVLEDVTKRDKWLVCEVDKNDILDVEHIKERNEDMLVVMQ